MLDFESIFYKIKLLDSLLNESSKKELLDDTKSMLIGKVGYFPCEVLELRNIFAEKQIQGEGDICLFSLGFARKYLNGYSVFLELNLSEIDNLVKKAGSFAIISDSELRISDILSRIIINKKKKTLSDQVAGIVSDYFPGIEIIVENNLPGMGKKAQSINPGESGMDESSFPLDNKTYYGPKRYYDGWTEGQIVKRRKGPSNPDQVFGKIVKKDKNIIEIMWDYDKPQSRQKQVFDILENRDALSAIVEKM